MSDAFADLPGWELVAPGLADVEAGRDSVAALLVAIGAPRLRRLGLAVPDDDELPAEAELLLYRRLCREQSPDPYLQYNSLLRRLIAFEQAAEGRLQRRT